MLRLPPLLMAVSQMNEIVEVTEQGTVGEELILGNLVFLCEDDAKFVGAHQHLLF